VQSAWSQLAFQRNIPLPSSGSSSTLKIRRAKIQFKTLQKAVVCSGRSLALFVTRFHVDFFLGLFLNPEDGGDIFLRNVGLTLKGLYGVIS
jgi:hypothetical protein